MNKYKLSWEQCSACAAKCPLLRCTWSPAWLGLNAFSQTLRLHLLLPPRVSGSFTLMDVCVKSGSACHYTTSVPPQNKNRWSARARHFASGRGGGLHLRYPNEQTAGEWCRWVRLQHSKRRELFTFDLRREYRYHVLDGEHWTYRPSLHRHGCRSIGMALVVSTGTRSVSTTTTNRHEMRTFFNVHVLWREVRCEVVSV